MMAISAATAADDWSFNEHNDMMTGYNETRLSVTASDLKTAFDLVCNQYGVQLLITGTGWKPDFYQPGLSWLTDSQMGGRMTIEPSDTLAGLRGAWPSLNSDQPKRLIEAIKSSDAIAFNFYISQQSRKKVIDTTEAGPVLALFLDSCLQ